MKTFDRESIQIDAENFLLPIVGNMTEADAEFHRGVYLAAKMVLRGATPEAAVRKAFAHNRHLLQVQKARKAKRLAAA